MGEPMVKVEASPAAVVDDNNAATATATATEAVKPAEATVNDDQQTAENDDAAKNESTTTEQSEKGETAEHGEQKNMSATKMLKTTAQVNEENPNANLKFDPSVMPETDDPVKIRAQVEFYFGDSNLPTDKHMWKITGGEENKPVNLKTICSFKRMARFQPYSAVVAAIRDSKFLDISGPEGAEEIKRKKPYVVASDNVQARLAASVYVKGFGDEGPTTQFDIEAFFAKYGPVSAIRLRRTEDKLFKGSVFAEFQSEELAKKFLELDPAPTWQGHELKIMSKKSYVNEKTKLIQEGKIEASSRPLFLHGKEAGGQGNYRGRGRGGKHDSNDWKKRRDDDQKHGFRDRRDNNRGGRGRGGRGGRGGRDDRNRRPRQEPTQQSTNNVQKPKIQSSELSAKVVHGGPSANGKRAREEDGGNTEPRPKKVDTKSKVNVEA